jgi:hypothetical protein
MSSQSTSRTTEEEQSNLYLGALYLRKLRKIEIKEAEISDLRKEIRSLELQYPFLGNIKGILRKAGKKKKEKESEDKMEIDLVATEDKKLTEPPLEIELPPVRLSKRKQTGIIPRGSAKFLKGNKGKLQKKIKKKKDRDLHSPGEDFSAINPKPVPKNQ